MAIEAKRGCGFRTVGSLYLVSDGVSFPCDRLTFEIPEVCDHCGGGTKFSRGWTWVNADKFFGGDHLLAFKSIPHNDPEVAEAIPDPQIATEMPCDCLEGFCSVCRPALMGERSALLWIGEKHYSPVEFKAEAYNMGVSKKIPAVPRDLVIGETWVLCAHKKAIRRDAIPNDPDEMEFEYFPGVFFAFRPTRLERIVKQSDLDMFQRVEFMDEDDREAWLQGNPYPGESRVKSALRSLAGESRNHAEDVKTYAKMARDKKRGITFVPVPDDDPDHNPEVKK